MKIIGIDTCSEAVSVGLVDDNKSEHIREKAHRQQLTILVPIIKNLLDRNGMKVSDVDLFAVTTGPGSFTGIRLGIATVKSLCQVNNIRAASVNTLDAIAAGDFLNSTGGIDPEKWTIVIPSMDAKKNEIFSCVYARKGSEIKRLSGYLKQSVDEYFNYLNTIENLEIPKSVQANLNPMPLITGSVFNKYGNLFEERFSGRYITTTDEHWYPNGLIVAALGKKIADKGDSTGYIGIVPNYMRESDAVPPASMV
ncbi:MAG: tRNA (adenosine(37)-N6)-threonylcarbamoyltransferase complex dimerization subunit type 1 TsaB [Firmicutes bacterium]|nr:tRNA (adenosine(37)-N6)-threonylcarbamoyltransferase complex dimerization subunit type 1 TsaB [Bacillota bacterium]